MGEKVSKKALIFSPFQGFPTHRYPESFITKKIANLGYEITYLVCNKIFSDWCTVHSGHGLTFRSSEDEKLKVCKLCIESKNKNSRSATLRDANIINIDSLLDIAKAETWLKSIGDITPNKISDITINDIPIGRLASYEFILTNKIADITKINYEQLKQYKTHLWQCLLVMSAIENITSSENFEFGLVYNHAYSSNNTFRTVLDRKGIPTSTIHAGYNLAKFHESLVMSWKTNFVFARDMIYDFLQSESKDNSHLEMHPQVIEHLSSLYSAKSVHVYSSGRTTGKLSALNRIGINKIYKKIALLAMSSEDEAHGALFSFGTTDDYKKISKVFPDQLTWVIKTIEFFKKHPDYCLIVRVHPREYPNKREKVVAEKAKEYDKLFNDLPSNVYINRPSDEVSLYDLFDEIDFNLVAHTSVGLEGALIGIPGISQVTGYGLYPSSYILQTPKDECEYYSAINDFFLNSDAYTKSTIEKALWWQTWFYKYGTLNIKSQYFRKLEKNSGIGKRMVRKIIRTITGESGFSMDKYSQLTSIDKNESVRLKRYFEEKIELYKALASGASDNSTPKDNNYHITEFLNSLINELYPERDDKSKSYVRINRLLDETKNVSAKLDTAGQADKLTL